MAKANINVDTNVLDNFKIMFNQLMNEDAEVRRQLDVIKNESAGEVLDRAVIANIMIYADIERRVSLDEDEEK